MLVIGEPAVSDPGRDLCNCSSKAGQEVPNHESLNSQPSFDHLTHVPGSGRLFAVVLGHLAGHGDPTIPLHGEEGGVEHLPADVVEVHVDSVQASVSDRLGEIGYLVSIKT